jgi:drug/metabolite transporter (DMT)-like permease
MQTTKTNFQLGSIYALVTAALLATQEPFSALAAKRLPPLSFVCLTQAALLLSVPILIARAGSRHDFSALLLTPRNLGKLAVLFLIGIAGLLLYNLGLRNAHPIIVAAILNLSVLGGHRSKGCLRKSNSDFVIGVLAVLLGGFRRGDAHRR